MTRCAPSTRRRTNPVMRGVALCACVVFSGVLPSLAADQAEPDWRSANRAIVEGHIIPRYRALARASDALRNGSERFCADPREGSLTFLRRLFSVTQDAWAEVQHIAVGPVEQQERRYRIQLWPDKHGTGAKQLRALLDSADTGALDPEPFRTGSVAVQGLAAMETLIFPEDQHAAEDFARDDAGRFRCALITAIAANLAGIGDEILDEWTAGDTAYALRIDAAGTGIGTPIGTGEPALGSESSRQVSVSFLRDLATGIERVVLEKLERPLGETPESARPTRAEAWRSRRSMALIQTSLSSLQHLYQTGFAPVLMIDPIEGALDDRIRLAFAAAISAADPGGASTDSLTDPARRDDAEVLLTRTRDLRALVGSKLPEALGLPLGFNSLDGD